MPAAGLNLTDTSRHRLRHVKPWQAGVGFTKSPELILGAAYGFRDLPISVLPTSSDFSEGHYLQRLNDAGEQAVTFPNKEASDGVPWRNRFSTIGHTEFLEFYRDDVLEAVMCILKVAPTQQAVEVSGQDGWFLLRDAYERDWETVMAPRDVIERFTYVQVLTLGDEFTEATLAEIETRWKLVAEHKGTGAGWAASYALARTERPGEPGLLLQVASGKGAGEAVAYVENQSTITPLPTAVGSRWSIIASFTVPYFTGLPQIILQIKGATFQQLTLRAGRNGQGTAEAGAGAGYFQAGEGVNPQASEGVTLPQGFTVGQHSMLLECDGRFTRAFIDGYLIGYLPALQGCTEVQFVLDLPAELNSAGVILQGIVVRDLQPLLMRGSEKGDYVLPGGPDTFPWGGLTGRYYNDSYLAGYTAYRQLCFAPNHTGTGPGGSYKDRTDATVNVEAPALPGAEATYWSCRWFGSVYLKLSSGNYTFHIGLGPTTSVRFWVGKTQEGTQLVNSWGNYSTRNEEAFLDAASLGGKDGWYPIILEFASGASGATSDYINLSFTPPVEYTDLGGGKLKAESQLVPATSLSPLGCVDQHYQGQSFFAITQEIAQAFGYQMYCEPQQLESGSFPGQLVPRVRVGRDTDEILEKDDIQSKSPMVGYKNTVDATDQATSLRGVGAGLPTLGGKGGQIQVEEYSLQAMSESLFDLQAWVDAGSINSPSLLGQMVATQLGLQEEPWQNVEGEPLAQDRQAYGFPVQGALAAFHWRPGDGIRIWLPAVNVEDLTCRQIMQVTRQFGPVGRHGTQMGFRQRPLDRISAVNKLLRHTAAANRKYQKTVVTLPATQIAEVLVTKTNSSAIYIPLQPADIVISAELHIIRNSAAQPIHAVVNGVDVTTGSGGPWTLVPTTIPIPSLRLAPVGSGTSSVYIQGRNEGASTTEFVAVPLVTVLR